MTLEWFWFAGLSAVAAGLAWLYRSLVADPEESDGAKILAGFLLLCMFLGAVSASLALSWDGVLGVVHARLAEVLPQPGSDIHETTRSALVCLLGLVWTVALFTLPQTLRPRRRRRDKVLSSQPEAPRELDDKMMDRGIAIATTLLAMRGATATPPQEHESPAPPASA